MDPRICGKCGRSYEPGPWRLIELVNDKSVEVCETCWTTLLLEGDGTPRDPHDQRDLPRLTYNPCSHENAPAQKADPQDKCRGCPYRCDCEGPTESDVPDGAMGAYIEALKLRIENDGHLPVNGRAAWLRCPLCVYLGHDPDNHRMCAVCPAGPEHDGFCDEVQDREYSQHEGIVAILTAKLAELEGRQ